MRSTLFEIFGIPIRSYGLMMVIGFGLGLWRAVRVSGKRYGIAPERVYDLALIVLLGGIVGSRIVYIMLNPDESWREFFALWQGGLSFHGGLIFAMLFGYVYTRIAKLSYWRCADLFAPSLAIGYAFTRIGCFLNGCCYGCPTSLPWGVRFHEGTTATPPSHPTQIYAFLANLLIFLALIRLEKINRGPGFVFVSYIGLYGIYRFLVESLRKGFSAEVWALGLTQAQAVSLGMIALSLALIVTLYRRQGSLKSK